MAVISLSYTCQPETCLKRSYFLPKSCTKTKTELLLLFTQIGISKGWYWNALFPIFSKYNAVSYLNEGCGSPDSSQGILWELLPHSLVPCFSHWFPTPLLLLWLELHSWFWISAMTQTKTKSSFSSFKAWFYPGPTPSLVLLCRAVQDEGGAGAAPGRGCTNTHLCHGTHSWASKSILTTCLRKAGASTHEITELAEEQTSKSSQSCKIGQGRKQVMLTACSSSSPKFRWCYH